MKIKHKLLELYWKLFGQPDVPPKLKNYKPEVLNKFSGELYIPRRNDMYEFYCSGATIEDIAKIYNVTRERVRQCCWKAYRESIRNRKG